MRAKASVKLTVPNGPRVNVGGGGTENHAKLKNLGFEESGHTGFQKELTREQLKAMINVQPNWNQNDEAADGFIKNRTHYEHTKTEEISIEWQSDMPVDNLGETKWVSYPEFSTTVPLVNGEILVNLETGQDVVVEVNEEGSAVIGTDYYLFEDYGNGTYGYTSGYPYEASEQTGTYARYSREIKIIVPLDEKYLPPDFVAKVEINKELISQNVGRIIAVEDKTAKLERDIASCGKAELIASDTLTEDTPLISPTISGRYKEIYWVFDIRPMSEIDTTDKARFYLFPAADKTTGKVLFQQGNVIVPNPTIKWQVMVYSKTFGNYARTELWFVNNKTLFDGAYGRPVDSSTQNGLVAPFAILPNPYIDGLTLQMTSSNGGRVFPAGTKYELWGVKA